jgi:hypothetical protein
VLERAAVSKDAAAFFMSEDFRTDGRIIYQIDVWAAGGPSIGDRAALSGSSAAGGSGATTAPERLTLH